MKQKYGPINIGKLGESIACKFLEEKNFTLRETNYRKPWGEIDIVAQETVEKSSSFLSRLFRKADIVLHFIEVKSVSCEMNEKSVPHETDYEFTPMDNMHMLKIKRLSRTIESYLGEHDFNGKWQFDVLCVWVDGKNKKSRVLFSENIVL